MNKNCLILMACYNGEKYIKEQIESIISQTFSNWNLLIRDDGSSDKTREIVKTFCKTDSRIEMVENTTGRHGAYLNFFMLIDIAKRRNQKYDYYFFADQDDIWMSGKLEGMMSFAEKSDYADEALMVYSDMTVINGEGKEIYPSLNAVMGIEMTSRYSLYFAHGFIWGCDSMINRKLFELVPVYPLDHDEINIMAHDCYYGKFALAIGRVLYIDKAFIKHRRHTGNTTGEYKLKLTAFNVINKFKPIALAKTHALVYNETLFAINQMEKNHMDNADTDRIKKIIQSGGVKAAFNMKRLGVHRKQLARTAGMYFIMISKLYKKYLVTLDK